MHKNKLIQSQEKKFKTSLDVPILSVSIIVTQTDLSSNKYFFNLVNLKLNDKILEEQPLDFLENKINKNNNVNRLLYILDKIQELVTRQFQDAEALNKPVELIFEI
ncbi:2537_t:CDS:1, partial [Cetraspora pellucida]